MLAYSLPADATDEYVKIGESTIIEIMKRFCRVVVEVFDDQYLRSPTTNDVARLLYIGEQCSFPGILGSLDCMHWRCKNCPTAWAGQYACHSGSPIIILEVVADYDLWISHAYFGMPGTNNDINVLESSHLFSNLANGIAPPACYVIQGKEYDIGYYLADSIYPKWSTIVQTIREPRSAKKKYFAMKQESCRKDVERAFRVLQSRFAIVAGPSRFWRKEVLRDIMTTYIILHNIIIEDERDLNAPIEDACECPAPTVEMAVDEDH
uniref:Nuclease HARBI1 n=2 Tax=Nicotiana TaxID=4085 RepID=A0A1S4DFN0_TOBAC|nr:PREDICTED: putative nuclease HARBI1 [Nicotiana sylvestris]XP_016512270.1 PREDICTED: putative nuclease HARBI1 [Nicotiana tabacum]